MRSLVQVLDQKIENWREKYVISIDNCRIHHSNDVNELIKKYRIPVIFSAPATPQILPLQMQWIRTGDVQPRRGKSTQKMADQQPQRSRKTSRPRNNSNTVPYVRTASPWQPIHRNSAYTLQYARHVHNTREQRRRASVRSGTRKSFVKAEFVKFIERRKYKRQERNDVYEYLGGSTVP